jgi:formate dehydrogenase iron-sulfur subunit
MTTMVPSDTRALIDDLLQEQQRFSAIERFARWHEHEAVPAQEKYYRELLPANRPGEGEQYAFAVDLDECTGCKACVAACHSLNGLDDEETWRSVGLLHGGTVDSPFQQTITTACHHCVEPACLEGCPVLAYEKDPITGIVQHLDDQCIGCQYCILKCPYDVPKYSPSRGIVRKCDMCTNRLAVGEAPACVQACPNEAIRITVVNKAEIASEARQGRFLAGAPAPDYTVPTTRYLTQRPWPPNFAPADLHQLKPQPPHLPLVVMLVFTQLSVGAFCVEAVLRIYFPQNLMTQLSPFHSIMALALGLLALTASTFHLGRPLQAWRSFIGLRTSWLSREILVFGLFAMFATLQATSFWLSPWTVASSPTSSALVSGVGLLGIFCSVMIYQDTRRPFWNGPSTALKFFGTSFLLGTASILFLTTLQSVMAPALSGHDAYHALTDRLAEALAVGTVLKLAFEGSFFLHLREKDTSPMRGTARLMADELGEITTARFLLGAIGGGVLPVAFLIEKPAPGWATLGLTIWLLVFVVLAEMLERRLFFSAVVAPRMPGSI